MDDTSNIRGRHGTSNGSSGSIEANFDKQSEVKDEKNYGTCQKCRRYYTNYEWCERCDPKLLTEGWTSDNETIDEIIKSTQLKATGYNNYSYLQWIAYDDLIINEFIGGGGYATIYKANWKNGRKYIDDNKRRCISDRTVALKKFHFPKISREFLKEVN